MFSFSFLFFEKKKKGNSALRPAVAISVVLTKTLFLVIQFFGEANPNSFWPAAKSPTAFPQIFLNHYMYYQSICTDTASTVIEHLSTENPNLNP